jgi:hypothetical protein
MKGFTPFDATEGHLNPLVRFPSSLAPLVEMGGGWVKCFSARAPFRLFGIALTSRVDKDLRCGWLMSYDGGAAVV